MREREPGLGPKIPFLNFWSWTDFPSEGEIYHGKGFGIFFKTHVAHRLNFVDTGEYWKATGRRKILREVHERRLMFSVSIKVIAKFFEITIRLWRVDGNE